ncbi:MAG: rhodanese-like domain-containing protein [Tenericutes bacterium]|nr:rhodanese-like domain-containing protein [Mycoplasmatota bacterium]
MKKLLFVLLVLPVIFLVSCGSNSFEVITAGVGKEMMDNDSTIVLVDVREPSEYQEEHIPGAILLSLGDIDSRAETVLEDKTVTYIVYCRSGNRSNEAAQKLVALGYESIYDMGGIIDWPYTTVSS